MMTLQIKQKFIYTIPLLLCLHACEGIETGDTLNPSITKQIKAMGLLDSGENIIRFYSNFNKKQAGNFFTNKRIAHYWIDSRDARENDTTFAWYTDITAIETVLQTPGTWAPYMKISSTHHKPFKVFVDGSDEEKKQFCDDAIKTWHAAKQKAH